MVILKNLASALRDGDPIRAVIVGSALSQDGRTQGIIMPSKPAQITAIKQAYEQANLQPQDTAYVEAHGM
jgi:iturin family lipopeptide synthetase A